MRMRLSGRVLAFGLGWFGLALITLCSELGTRALCGELLSAALPKTGTRARVRQLYFM